jgi:quercetin dioxygenase-like cupin family protein
LDEKDLNAPNTVLQINIVEPKANLKPHYHRKMTEAVYILDGEASIIINGKEFPLKPGDLITIKPNQIHTVKNPSEKEFRYLVFKTNYSENDKYYR